MRPIRLTMSGFGPYSQSETIDFTELGERNLFLVTGPTGAGKTTVFDAISFALFGKASGELRSEESLRSHFAAVDLSTEVKLTFELKGMVYHITRRPKQERPKKRGEGTITDQAKATLIIEDGEPRTVVEGVGNVTEKIERVLGINERQFKQIMMIPQGEFRKLLMAESKEREKVLRQLFDTHIYRQIQMDLDEQSRSLYKEISIERTTIKGMLSGVKYGDNETLKGLLDADHSSIEQILEAVTDQIQRDKMLEKDQSAIVDGSQAKITEQISKRKEAETNNTNLKQLEEARKKGRDYDVLAASIAIKQERLVGAKSALKLIPLEENIITRAQEMTALKTRSGDLVTDIEQHTKGLKKVEEVLAEVQSDAYLSGLKKQESDLIKLKALVEKVDGLDQLTDDHQTRKKALDKVSFSVAENTSKLEKLLGDLAANQTRFKETSDVDVRLQQKKTSLEKVELTYNRLKQSREQLDLLDKEVGALQKEKQDITSLETLELEKLTAYKKAKLTFLQNQAAIIAKELQENLPCPVCGSTDHPTPAQMTNDMVSEEVLEEYEASWQKAQKSSEAAKNAYVARFSSHESRLESEVTTVKELLVGMEETFAIREGLNVEIAQVSELVASALAKTREEVRSLSIDRDQLLKEQENYKVLSELLVQQEKEKELLRKESTDLTTKLNELTVAIAELTTKLKHIHSEVPEAYRTKEALRSAIDQLAQAIKNKERAIDQATDNHVKAKEKLIKLETESEQMTLNIASSERELTKLKETLNEELSQSDFDSEEAYRIAKRTEEEINILEEEVKTYQDQVLSLKTIVNELENTIKNKEVVSLEDFDGVIEALEKQRKDQADLLGVIKARITDNKDIKSRVKTSNDRIKDKSDKYNVIGELARVAGGNNKAMMTFERFVLARFFEDIITAANIRLKQMTQNRYELMRSEDVQHKARQSGLELNVIDHFTGKPRHVKTLSGGESFKASLSMALGLSDVVQSYAGGVRLDTMFIDEGFGTLDQESLDSAINCLIDLQKSGRLVGIISHVQELKERIDTRLEVRSGSLGSECGFVIGS